MADLTHRPDLVPVKARAQELARVARSENTRRAYASAWAAWERWASERGLPTLPAPPDVLALYLADRGTELRAATLRVHLAAVGAAHRSAGLDDPTKAEVVRVVFRGLRRAQDPRPGRKAPLRVRQLLAIVDDLGDGLRDRRDRAVLLLGFALGARRSELVALDVADLTEVAEGLKVTIWRSKGDQEGHGRVVGVPFASRPSLCPVRAVAAWRTASGIDGDALLRSVTRWDHVGGRLSARTVARIVQDRAALAGLDPAEFGGHSLRAGLATEAAAAGAPERTIMDQTGHRSLSVARRYIRDGSLFRKNAAAIALEHRE